MLSALELSALRADIAAEFLPQTATIQRRQLLDDGNGGKTAQYAAAGTTACRLAYAGSKDEPTRKDATEGGRIVGQVLYVLTLPADVAIDATDRFEIDGGTYELISPPPTRFEEVTRRLLVKKL